MFSHCLVPLANLSSSQNIFHGSHFVHIWHCNWFRFESQTHDLERSTLPMEFYIETLNIRRQKRRRGGQVVRRRSRKPKIAGSNPVRAFWSAVH